MFSNFKVANTLFKTVKLYVTRVLGHFLFYMKNGYGGNIILREMSKKIITSNKLSDKQKSLIFLKLSSLDNLLNNSSDEELILINFLTYFSNVLQDTKNN